MNSYYGPYIFMPIVDEERMDDQEVYKPIKPTKPLFNPDDALIYGNLFKDEYIPYKNYIPRLPNVMTEQDALLLKIQIYTEASQDVKLALDVYPRNTKYMNLLKEYTNITNQFVNQYESKYGPLFSGNSKNKNNYFTWVETPSVFEN